MVRLLRTELRRIATCRHDDAARMAVPSSIAIVHHRREAGVSKEGSRLVKFRVTVGHMDQGQVGFISTQVLDEMILNSCPADRLLQLLPDHLVRERPSRSYMLRHQRCCCIALALALE